MKSFKKVITLALSFIMLFTYIPFNVGGTAWAANQTYNLSDDPEAYNLDATVRVKGADFDPDAVYNDEDPFEVVLNFKLPTNGVYDESDVFEYALPDGVFALDDVNDGVVYGDREHTIVYGSYTVENNLIRIKYNSDFLALGNKTSNVRFEGSLDVNRIPGDPSHQQVDIPGIGVVDIHVVNHKGLAIEKNATTRIVENESEHKVFVDYEVKVKSNADNRNVKLYDELVFTGEYRNGTTSQHASMTVTYVGASLNGEEYTLPSGTYRNFSTAAHHSAKNWIIDTRTNTIPHLSKGDELIIRYTVQYKEPHKDYVISHLNPHDDTQPFIKGKFDNEITASSTDSSSVSDKKIVELDNTYLYKRGRIEDKDTLEWFITVHRGEYETLTIKDDLGPHHSIADDAVVDLYLNTKSDTISGADKVGTTTWGELKNGYEFSWRKPDGSIDDRFLIIRYNTHRDEDANYTNKATILETGRHWSATVQSSTLVKTTGKKTLVGAEMGGEFGDEGYWMVHITSQLDMKIASAAVAQGENFVIYDKSGEQQRGDHYCTDDSASNLNVEEAVPVILYKNSEGNYVDTDEDGNPIRDRFVISKQTKNIIKFVFKDGNVIPGEYRIKVVTLFPVKKQVTNQTEIGNRLYWTIDDEGHTTSTTAEGWSRYCILNKVVKTASEIKNDEITWKIQIPDLKFTMLNVFSESFPESIVKETIPKGLDFVAAAYDNKSPEEGCEGYVEPISTSTDSNGNTVLVFEAKASKSLYIKTRYNGDYTSLTKSVSYTNNVQIAVGKDGKTPVALAGLAAKATATIDPPTIVDKQASYPSAPAIKYTVNINTNAVDLISENFENQTYKMVDTMSNSIVIDKNSLRINGETIDKFPYLEYDQNSRGTEFTIDGFLDEVAYVITYDGVPMDSVGTELGETNGKNTVKLFADEIVLGEDTTITSGKVKRHEGISGGETARFRISKVDNTQGAKPVKNAEFTLYDFGTGTSPAANGTEVGKYTTDKSGNTEFFDIEYGHIYGLVESDVPYGYTDPTNGEMKYFIHLGWDQNIENYDSNIVDTTEYAAYEYKAVNNVVPVGDLEVSKTVEGNDVDADQEFEFKVTLSEKRTNGIFGDMVFENGVATFKLKGGEKKTATGLLSGTTYKVEETNAHGYECSAPDGIGGTIAANDKKTAAFTNTKNSFGSLEISKTVSGNAASKTKKFEFTIELSQAINDTLSGVKFTKGVAKVELADGDKKVIEGLPNGVTYTITESDYSNDGYVIASQSGETGSIEGNKTSKAAFVNERNAAGSLTISKTLKGNDVDDSLEFKFEITLSDTSINDIFSGVKFTGGVAEITLKGGENKVIEGLPNGTGYSVTETETQGYTCEQADGIQGTIDEKTPAVAAFTNSHDSFGSLKVAKSVMGNDKIDGASFRFTVTLSDQTISGVYGDMEFTNGVAVFDLADKQAKTATGLPNGVTYTVVEEDCANAGYETEKTGDSGTISGGKQASAIFVNTRNSFGNLELSKTVNGNACDTSKSFEFTVTLGDKTIDGTYGEMVFSEGVATVSLSDGEKKTATNLPNGTTYTITEKSYASEGYVVSEKSGDQGTIKGNETIKASFTNTRDTYGNLTVSKVVTGNAGDNAKPFEFTVTLDQALNGTYGDMNFTGGVATFTLTNGQSKTALNLPNGVGYTVSEKNYANDGYETSCTGEQGRIAEGKTAKAEFTNERNTYGDLTVSKTVDGNACDKTKAFEFTVSLDQALNGTYGDMSFTDGIATFTLADGESKTATGLPNGVNYTVSEKSYADDGYVTKKSGDEGTIEGGKQKTAAFTNTRNAEGSLTVSKTVEGNDINTDKAFTFTITLDDTSINKTYSGVEFRNGVAELTLKDGQSKTIEGLPNGIGYTVLESDYDDYKCSDPNGIQGTIDEKSSSVAAFTNTRNTYGNLTVGKTVTGNAGSRTQKFEFTVTLSDKSINGLMGEMNFTDGIAVVYLMDGQTATARDLPNGISYSVVETTADGYELASKSGDNGSIRGGETKTASFTNNRDTFGDLTVSKSVTGNAGDNAKPFEFTVTLDQALNGTYGDMSFANGVATFTLTDGQSKTARKLPNGVAYEVVEKDYRADGYIASYEGADSGVIAGDELASVTVTNERNASGSLTISKTLEGNDYDADKEFTFYIDLHDESINATFSDVEFKNGKAEVVLKGGESKLIEGLPNRTEYTVTEEDYSELGYECSNPDGISGKIDENKPAVAAFTNTRNTYGDLTVSKSVVGRTASKTKVFEFRVELDDESITGQFGDMYFENGVAVFELSHGESKTAEGLPNGVGYTVVEKDYSSEGYMSELEINGVEAEDENSITGDETSEASFVNDTRGIGGRDEMLEPPNTGDRNAVTPWFLLGFGSLGAYFALRRRKAA